MVNRSLAPLATAVLLSLPGCGREAPAAGAGGAPAESGAVIATVDGLPITRGELDRRVRRAAEGQSLADPGLRRALLDQLVEERVLLAEAKRRGLVLSQADIEAAAGKARAAMGPDAYATRLAREGLTDEGFLAEVGDGLHVRAILATAPAPKPITEHEVRSYYQAHRAEFAQPDQYRARLITAASRKEAEALRAQVTGGADFAALATAKSISPDKARGGDLGFVPQGQLPPEFDVAVASLRPGEVSPVVESPFGYHVIRLEERRAGGQRTLDQARDEIFRVLNTTRRESAHEAWLAGLVGKADIKILDPELQAADTAAGAASPAAR
jgi:parvulin-like peptidyl-prolyl isomerase